MVWKERSVFHKVVFIVGMLCALAYFILSIANLTGVLPENDTIVRSLWSIFCLSQGIVCWKNRRGLAITWVVLSGLNFLMGIISLFV